MDFGGSSDPFIQVALGAGLITLIMTIALSLQVLVMRHRTLRREQRREAMLARWRPLMFEVMLGGDPTLPELLWRDEETFLLLWNQLQEGVRGEPRARLNRLAEAVGADDLARRRLYRDDVLGRVLALCTLGHLGRASDYERLVRHLDDPRTYLSLATARALVHIDPRKAPDDILPRLAIRTDWPVALFATVLAQVDVDQLSGWFQHWHSQLSAAQLVRLLPLASILNEKIVEEILDPLLTSRSDPEILSAALKQVRSPALLRQVCRACEHEAWAVRTQAAAALGRVGGLPERDRLLRLLCDPQWWVRYRAAQALIAGPFGSAADITELAVQLQDRFALDIIEHALAEERA